MCVRTKNSYGCGHNYKETADCRSSRCPGIDRFAIKREGDCRSCKAGGTTITRGMEGKGRYAQEHKLQSKDREPLADASGNSIPEPLTSPWNPEASKPLDIEEKKWRKPVRQGADQAWLAEHAEREQSMSPRNSPASSPQNSPPTRDPMLDLENHRSPRYHDDNEGRLHREMKKMQDIDLRSERRRQDRHNSYDSFESVEIEERSPRGRTHSYGHRSHVDSPAYSHSSRPSHRTYGSYDSSFIISSSPYSYGHSHVYDSYFEPAPGYTMGFGSGHGVGGVVRDPGAKWRRF